MTRALPSFDLVVATVGRAAELGRLLDSLDLQTHRSFRVVVVDQNDDDRVSSLLADRDYDVLRVRSERGLSRARNVALDRLAADVVAFPDDDCVYPLDLLQRVAERFATDEMLDGLSVRIADRAGRSDRGWGSEPTRLTKANLWNLAASAGIFLRRSLVERIGRFDERIGIGSLEAWASGEETDYVIRALQLGARIEYEPSIVVKHELRPTLPAQGFREGASVGYLLRKHRYPPRVLARMAVRPAGGAAVSLARLDIPSARFHAATLRGRVRGYLGARRSNSSA